MNLSAPRCLIVPQNYDDNRAYDHDSGTDLARRLNTHPNYLSQVINEKEGKNLYDYVNTLRIEEFIKLVSQPHNQNLTLLSLAYECGFNSKSSFNRYFKKTTGQSPSEYLKQLHPEAVPE